MSGGVAGERPRGFPLCLSLRVRSYPHFYGGASERRPWALKRDDRPKGVPNCVLPLPTAPDKPVKKVRNSPENNLRILRGKIVTRYSNLWVIARLPEAEGKIRVLAKAG